MANFLDPKKPTTRALLIGVQTPDMASGEGAELLSELHELVENIGLSISPHSQLISLRDRAQPKFLIGSGKTAEIIAIAKEDGADVIVIDEELSPAQQRNWEEESGLAVIDRQEVILEIFADRAQTREAVLQVALARMEYSLPRLTRAWSHLSRQRGKGKMGGEGETQLEQDRRLVRNRITHLKEELVQVISQRATQRRKRQRTPVPGAAIVGYTNAGKSTLLNKLTGAQVLAADKLFATLDPTTRQLALPDGRTLLLTDTVGFIRRLPHRLVEAFKATLEEVVAADFLIHLLDGSNPNVDHHHETTLAVLGELGAAERPTLTVFNKTDAIEPKTLARLRAQHPEALFISVHTGEGLDKLLARFEELAVDDQQAVELLIPHSRYDVVAKLHGAGRIKEQESLDEGVRISGRFPRKSAALFTPFLVEPKPAKKKPAKAQRKSR
ncbi:GTPase HflX [Oleiharenicola lentus]|uniref:GTPase HflX n=1 Tax=Oleiharenicola lentus TaxID=2508720 RepID=UPI003F66B925